MNLTTTEEHYRPIVEQCEQQLGSVAGLQSLEPLLGCGRYKVFPGGKRKDGRVLHILYWVRGTRSAGNMQHLRIGAFELDGTLLLVYKTREREKEGNLTLGRDELGRKLIRVAVAPNCEEYLCVAVEYELVRGEWLPRPCHDTVAQAFRG